MNERERLIELLSTTIWGNLCEHCGEDRASENEKVLEVTADYLLKNGVIVPPCKVGDTVYYINTVPHISLYLNTIYKAEVVRIVTTHLGTSLVIQIHNDYGCTEIPDIKDFGRTVFLTREEAEKALKEVQEND